MVSNLERIGVQTVVEGILPFEKDLRRYGQALSKGTKATTQFSKASSTAGKKAGKSAGGFQSLFSSIRSGQGAVGAAVPGVNALGGAIGALTNPITIVTAAVIGLGTAIFKLGLIGAQTIGVETAFQNITRDILETGQTSEDFLADLRAGADDTIPALELMRLTNLALAGSMGELKEGFGQALPKLLEISRVQAQATGQSVDFLFQSLVVGLKRASPRLIDNTGLMISLGNANQRYADKLGVSVAALTDQQKSLALIDETLRAGQTAIDAAGGATATAAVEFARSGALVQNTISNIGVAFEPILREALEFINGILTGVEALTMGFELAFGGMRSDILLLVGVVQSAVAPIIEEFQIMADRVRVLLEGNVGEALRTIVDVVIALATAVAAAFGFMVRAVMPQIIAFQNLVFGMVDFLAGLVTPMVSGAINMMAAYGNALMAAANTFIFPVVIAIAQFIADFLTGFSPAKEGPLSEIDTGAANLMGAWVDGFIGGFTIDPIRQVAAEVNAALGSIATLGIEQVERRLQDLDNAIRPFQERVSLLEAAFQRLSAPAEAAFKLIDDQLEIATQALTTGDAEAARLVQTLNVQRAAIEDQLALRDKSLAQAQIQLALAEAQQAHERTALEIQKARLGPAKALTKEQKKRETQARKAGRTRKEAQRGAGAGVPTAVPGIPTIAEPGFEPKAEDLEFGVSFLPTTPGSELIDQFIEGLDAGGELTEFQTNLDLLGTQVDRIATSNPVQAIAGAFSDLGNAIGAEVRSAVAWFTDPDMEGGFAHFFARLTTEGVSAVFGDFTMDIMNWVGDTFVLPLSEGVSNATASIGAGFATFSANIRNNPKGMLGDIASHVGTWALNSFGLPINDKLFDLLDPTGTLQAKFSTFADDLRTDATGTLGAIAPQVGVWALNSFGLPITDKLFDLLNPQGTLQQKFTDFATRLEDDPGATLGLLGATIGTWALNNLVFPITDKIRDLLDPEMDDSVPMLFSGMAEGVFTAVGDLKNFIVTNIFDPISLWASGEVEGGGLPELIKNLIDPWSNIPIGLFNALRNVGLLVWDVFVKPIIQGINLVLERFNELWEQLTGSGIVQWAADVLQLEIPGFHLNPLDTNPPGALLNPSARALNVKTDSATGGIFTSGAVNVGERGREVAMSAEPFAVFSNQFVRAIDTFANVIMNSGFTSVAAAPMAGGGTQSVDNSININTTTQTGFNEAEMANRIAIARVFKR